MKIRQSMRGLPGPWRSCTRSPSKVRCVLQVRAESIALELRVLVDEAKAKPGRISARLKEAIEKVDSLEKKTIVLEVANKGFVEREELLNKLVMEKDLRLQETEAALVSEILTAKGEENVWGLMKRFNDHLESRHKIFINPDPKSFWMKILDEYPAVVKCLEECCELFGRDMQASYISQIYSDLSKHVLENKYLARLSLDGSLVFHFVQHPLTSQQAKVFKCVVEICLGYRLAIEEWWND